MEKNDEKKQYTMKETIDMTGLTDDLIRTYTEEFNIQVERTKGNHRRFSVENIEMLLSIKKKISEQNWSYNQVRDWLNGDITTELLKESQISTNLEKKLDLILDELKASKERELQMQQVIAALTNEIANLKTSQYEHGKLLLSTKERIERTDEFITEWRTKRLESPEKEKEEAEQKPSLNEEDPNELLKKSLEEIRETKKMIVAAKEERQKEKIAAATEPEQKKVRRGIFKWFSKE